MSIEFESYIHIFKQARLICRKWKHLENFPMKRGDRRLISTERNSSVAPNFNDAIFSTSLGLFFILWSHSSPGKLDTTPVEACCSDRKFQSKLPLSSSDGCILDIVCMCPHPQVIMSSRVIVYIRHTLNISGRYARTACCKCCTTGDLLFVRNIILLFAGPLLW